MNIYVGNLSYGMTETTLQELFGQYGQVDRASVVTDRETGRSRGFGFVEMPDDEQAQKAIDELNETEHDGRALKVNQARPKTDRPRGGGGGGGRGGYGRR